MVKSTKDSPKCRECALRYNLNVQMNDFLQSPLPSMGEFVVQGKRDPRSDQL